ncbi:MAG: E3 binding domain-containing protein [Nanoarchaeota archaeon]|nr:E3 binding domain-containing protein [Nanoarchaeota archaeon]
MSEEPKEDEEQYTGSVVGFLEEASDEDVHLHKQDNSGQAAKRIVKAAPFVRALAKRLKVDLESVAGTGPDGRVTKEDVEAAGK